jgi:hypothetical protein
MLGSIDSPGPALWKGVWRLGHIPIHGMFSCSNPALSRDVGRHPLFPAIVRCSRLAGVLSRNLDQLVLCESVRGRRWAENCRHRLKSFGRLPAHARPEPMMGYFSVEVLAGHHATSLSGVKTDKSEGFATAAASAGRSQ